MSVVVALLAVVVALLAVVVVGLLRAHADVLRALDRLGAGRDGDDQPARVGGRQPAPSARTGRPAADLSGTTLDGGAQVIRVIGADRDTLLLFLSSGCLTCQAFWQALREPGALGLPDRIRVVAVTKDLDQESPSTLSDLAPARGVVTLLSSQAWEDYQVPGSPYAVLVDGSSGRVVGEGTGADWEQVGNLLAQATGDLAYAGQDTPHARKARHDMVIERDTDDELLAAGIRPGDASLYPRPTNPPDEPDLEHPTA